MDEFGLKERFALLHRVLVTGGRIVAELRRNQGQQRKRRECWLLLEESILL